MFFRDGVGFSSPELLESRPFIYSFEVNVSVMLPMISSLSLSLLLIHMALFLKDGPKSGTMIEYGLL